MHDMWWPVRGWKVARERTVQLGGRRGGYGVEAVRCMVAVCGAGHKAGGGKGT